MDFLKSDVKNRYVNADFTLDSEFISGVFFNIGTYWGKFFSLKTFKV